MAYKDIYPVVRGHIIPAVSSGWSFVLVKGKNVIGLSIQYEMEDALKMPKMPTKVEMFDKLAQSGKDLEHTIKRGARGENIYGFYGVIDPDYAGLGLSLKFWWNLFSIGKIAGWNYYYSRISSEISLKMLKKLGAEELGHTTVKTSSGEEHVWMIRIDLRAPFPSYSMLNAMIKMKQPTAKL